jgi:hypothetical protein
MVRGEGLGGLDSIGADCLFSARWGVTIPGKICRTVAFHRAGGYASRVKIYRKRKAG